MPGFSSFTRHEHAPQRNFADDSICFAVSDSPSRPTSARPRPKIGRTIGPFAFSRSSSLSSSVRTKTASSGFVRSRRTTLNETLDRKSTRLNSSHLGISYAVFCLKKKKQNIKTYKTKTMQKFNTVVIWHSKAMSSNSAVKYEL